MSSDRLIASEASLSKKRKSSSVAARPSESATGEGSSSRASASTLSLSSSSSSPKPSSSSTTLPYKVLPANPLEHSFARARELEDNKRRRTASNNSSSSTVNSRHIGDENSNSKMSIDPQKAFFPTTNSASSSTGIGLGRAGPRTGDTLKTVSLNGMKGSAPVVRRTDVQGRQPVKKLVIKNFTVTPELPKDYELERWKVLQQAIHAIQESKPVTSSLEELYRTCENLCHQKYGDTLYKKLSAEVETHIHKVVERLLNSNLDQDTILEAVHTAWADHCRQLIMIRSIFLYLDRTFVLQTQGVSSIWDMGLDLWRRLVMNQQEIRTKVLAGILRLIDKDRGGDIISQPLILSLLRMLTDINLYASVFETPFLQNSRLYYHVEGETNVHRFTVPEYLRYAQQRLVEETNRFEGYLDKSTRGGLISAVEGELLERWTDMLLQKGFESVMVAHSLQDLRLWHDLLTRVNGLEKLSIHFGNYVKKTGKALVIDPSRDDQMVEGLLKFKQEVDEVVSNCFQNSELFLNVLKECFESFINTRQNKPAELVAKYLDLRLRSGNKDLTDEELESTLDRVLILFRYIQGKDVFEAFYKRDLAKRLLLNKSASFDAEKSMLSKLKAECGAGFTTKLEGMFKDMDISKDIMVNFRASKMYNKMGNLDLHVNVLTQGNWPTYPPAEANIPDQISQCQEVFKEFYLSKHKGRRLMWQNSLGHSVVKAHFPSGTKELQLSLFQAIILLLFNDVDESHLSYKEIKQLSNIDPKELDRTLQSLACGKYRVLVKHPKSKDVSETDEFSFNKDFTASLTRIKINAIQLKETQEENASTNERIFQDRQFQVDAAIVRIMKTRKQLSHTLLMSELFEQLKFSIKPTDLKKRIESLIDRDYLERDKNDQSLYKYVA
ncbi:ubiquitin-protein ligase, cullin 4 [Lobosporangium transversale]|uniref:Cullin-4 n=1 Tax=Lobosporangium transversale TaxID=64571 RepID=A0A1Y2GKR7_9FUNG|nr:ubiquitin-protein ligase, cullin 4 [Lobosporangium transversale]ORZ12473.1 ubiquitin-protein ligase, cullin 4 [Lobosporangium transversale]|eukprot:XP_021880092.1 ubiquitin-protein ligase, cullin 4 [Lobosporangium transversale]